jgi:hypothetical protein
MTLHFPECCCYRLRRREKLAPDTDDRFGVFVGFESLRKGRRGSFSTTLLLGSWRWRGSQLRSGGSYLLGGSCQS